MLRRQQQFAGGRRSCGKTDSAPREVVDRIYRANAQSMFPGAWKF
jgi:hypothetical protein